MAKPIPYLLLSSLYRFLGFSGTSQYSGEQIAGPLSRVSGPVDVREDTALALSAVFNCVRILAETVAAVPRKVERKVKGEWVADEEHELNTLLNLRPNPYMTAQDMWEATGFNLGLRGNGYQKILRNSTGRPIGLYPLAAAQTRPLVLKDGTGWYIYDMDGEQQLYAAEDVLHFRIFGNGRIGVSPLEYGARSIGLGLAADQYAGTFFSKGAKPGGVLQIDRILTTKQRAELRESFSELHEGADAAHKLFVLEAGMKYQQVQLSPEGAQLLDTRRFNVKDVARFFGVPAFLINESEGSTSWGTGLEQQMLGFYNLVISPHARRIAATAQMQLIPVAQQRTTRIVCDFDELMSVDLKAKAEYYTKLSTGGLITLNEARRKLGMPPILEENANKLLIQGAMMPIGRLGDKPANPAALPHNTGTKGAHDA